MHVLAPQHLEVDVQSSYGSVSQVRSMVASRTYSIGELPTLVHFALLSREHSPSTLPA